MNSKLLVVSTRILVGACIGSSITNIFPLFINKIGKYTNMNIPIFRALIFCEQKNSINLNKIGAVYGACIGYMISITLLFLIYCDNYSKKSKLQITNNFKRIFIKIISKIFRNKIGIKMGSLIGLYMSILNHNHIGKLLTFDKTIIRWPFYYMFAIIISGFIGSTIEYIANIMVSVHINKDVTK